MKNIFLDADVLLDFFLKRNPHHLHTAKIMALCYNKEIQGFTSPVILCNVFYILKKTASRNQVIEKMNALVKILRVLPTTEAGILKALNSGFGDFEDAVQNFTAASFGKIDYFITRNTKDYKSSALIVLNPEDYINGLDK